jgi:NADH-quinone oxidoreductase subunit E
MFAFNEDNQKKFDQLLARYPSSDALMLPSLWMVQYQEGYISEEAMVYIAERLDKSPMQVYQVVTFYSMFLLKPIGKYHIQLCKTLSCKLRGSVQIKEHIKQKLGIEVGETTKDGRFTLTEVECLGACGGAPAMSFNDDYVEKLTIEKIDEILEQSR